MPIAELSSVVVVSVIFFGNRGVGLGGRCSTSRWKLPGRSRYFY